MQTGNIQLLKNINEQIVLNLIHKHKLISGAELANITGMQASTIAKLLKSLEAKSLILNRGKGESTYKGGKRPFLWSLNNEVGYVIGIDLEINQTIGVLLDFEGNKIYNNHYTNRPIASPDDLADMVMHIVKDLTGSKDVELSNLLGLGVGIAGIVNTEQGIIVTTDLLPQTSIPLREMLEDYYDFPIFVENNANAAAMGEKWLGRGKDIENFIITVVDIDRGVGGLGIGLVLRNELFYGAKFAAGELNFSLTPLDVELRSQQSRLVEGHILSNYIDSLDKLDIHTLIDAAKKDDKFALDYFKRLGYQVGREISCAVGLINPEMVIIEGEVAELGKLITEPIKSAIDLEVHDISSSSLEIEPGIHGRYSVSIGAASIILNDIFRMPSVISNSINTYFE